jgi:hypothetical protein
MEDVIYRGAPQVLTKTAIELPKHKEDTINYNTGKRRSIWQTVLGSFAGATLGSALSRRLRIPGVLGKYLIPSITGATGMWTAKRIFG